MIFCGDVTFGHCLRQMRNNNKLKSALSDKDFIALIDQHQLLIWKVCNVYAFTNHDRQDLFQEIVIQLWQSHAGFNGNSKFSTWLYRVALNTAVTRLRKKKPDLHFLESAELTASANLSTEAGTDDPIRLMYASIEQLNEIERAIVMLYLEDKSYAEMEEILGINQGALRVRMNRIKDKLKTITKSV
jgi:RNA polymerase sigma-70 factor (ECF subfamily)